MTTRVVKFLLMKNADAEAGDAGGNTSIEYAKAIANDELREMTLRLLLSTVGAKTCCVKLKESLMIKIPLRGQTKSNNILVFYVLLLLSANFVGHALANPFLSNYFNWAKLIVDVSFAFTGTFLFLSWFISPGVLKHQ